MRIKNQGLWLSLFNHDRHERRGCRAEYSAWNLVALGYCSSRETDGQDMEGKGEGLVETG